MNNTYGKTKEERFKTERAHEYFMNIQNSAADYLAYILIVNQTKEQAERILNTPLA